MILKYFADDCFFVTPGSRDLKEPAVILRLPEKSIDRLNILIKTFNHATLFSQGKKRAGISYRNFALVHDLIQLEFLQLRVDQFFLLWCFFKLFLKDFFCNAY